MLGAGLVPVGSMVRESVQKRAAKKQVEQSLLNNKIDEKITNFFFSAIHKNYLNNRKR